MIVRTLVTMISLAAVVASVALQYLVPALAVYLFYGLLGWILMSFWIYRLPVMSRPVFGGRGGPSVSTAPRPFVGVPLPSNPEGTPLTFCAYCATPVEPGTPVCPACGHAIPAF